MTPIVAWMFLTKEMLPQMLLPWVQSLHRKRLLYTLNKLFVKQVKVFSFYWI